MSSYSEGLTSAVEQVFRSMLKLPLRRAKQEDCEDISSEGKVSSAVGITGDWNGAVMLECSTSTARLLAGAMLGPTTPDSVDEDVRDVIGEITNMVAGNFKSTLPGNSVLTLPWIIVGSDYSMDIISGKPVWTESLVCEGKGIVLSLIEENGRP
jgi:chemotaxis protein CheX